MPCWRTERKQSRAEEGQREGETDAFGAKSIIPFLVLLLFLSPFVCALKIFSMLLTIASIVILRRPLRDLSNELIALLYTHTHRALLFLCILSLFLSPSPPLTHTLSFPSLLLCRLRERCDAQSKVFHCHAAGRRLALPSMHFLSRSLTSF